MTSSRAKTTTMPPEPPIPWAAAYAAAPTTPADGRVNTQAVAIRPATLHRTVAPCLPTPEPRIEPVATWVVDSEYPKWLDSRIVAADEDSAAMPWGDSISTSPLPSVRMTRQPPA